MTCLIRKAPIVLTPEEKVRQAFLHVLIEEAGYPASLIAVEFSLSSLPHLKHQKTKIPDRRADILVFSSEMTPLVLIECKAGPLTKLAERQVIGYNLFVKAPYIVLAGSQEIKTALYSNGGWNFLPGLPHYSQIKSTDSF